MVSPMIVHMIRDSMRTLPSLAAWLSLFVFMLMRMFITDHYFGGLHAFGVDLLLKNAPRTAPAQVHQFAGCRRGIGKGTVNLVGHVALIGIKDQIVTLAEEKCVLLAGF